MSIIKRFFETKKTTKIILILLILIVLIGAILFIFNSTTKLVNNLNKINGTYYNLEKNNKTIAYYSNCKIAIYPTENLKNMELIDNELNQEYIYLLVGSKNKSSLVSISIVSTEEKSDIIETLNELTDTKQPTVSKEYNTFNYFVYDGKNYYYNLNESGGAMFTTPINDKYFYWVMISDYKGLTKEDIESILYFEVI